MEKSITVKVSSDTKDFIRGVNDANSSINKTQKSADSLQKSLKLEFSEAKFNTAQKKYQQALAQTEEQAVKLREKLKELEDAGKMDTADYYAIEERLAQAEVKATTLKKSLEDLDKIKLENVKTKTQQIGEAFQKTGASVEKLGKSMNGLSVASAGILASGGAIAKTASDNAKEIYNLSKQYDVSAEKIQEWNYIAEQSGVSSSAFEKSLKKMKSAMADFISGNTSKGATVLESLGIDPTNYKNAEEMFDGIIIALANVKDGALQTALANDLFGDAIATEMLPYINSGASAINNLRAEFQSFSYLTNEQVDELSNLNDSFTRLSTAMTYAKDQVGVALAPVVERFIDFIENTAVPAIQSFADWFSNLSPFMQDTIVAVVSITAVMAPMITIFGKSLTAIGGLIKGLQSLNRAQLAVAGSLMLISAGLEVFDLITNWNDFSATEKALKSITAVLLGVAGALMMVQMAKGGWGALAYVAMALAGGAAILGFVNSAIKSADSSAQTLNTTATEPSDSDYSSWLDRYNSGSGSGSTTYDNSSSTSDYNINIYIQGTELSAEEIAEQVSEKIATLAQARR